VGGPDIIFNYLNAYLEVIWNHLMQTKAEVDHSRDLAVFEYLKNKDWLASVESSIDNQLVLS
jgi:hypothetical protein